MSPALTRWTLPALVLILASSMLYLFVILAERHETTSVQQGQSTHVESGNEEGHDENAEGAPEGSNSTDETIVGINLESPLIVTAVLALWSMIALGLVWPARWALFGGMGLGALFVPGDLFELANKARTGDAGLMAAVVIVGLMHVGIVYLCWRAVRSTSSMSTAGSQALSG